MLQEERPEKSPQQVTQTGVGAQEETAWSRGEPRGPGRRRSLGGGGRRQGGQAGCWSKPPGLAPVAQVSLSPLLPLVPGGGRPGPDP